MVIILIFSVVAIFIAFFLAFLEMYPESFLEYIGWLIVSMIYSVFGVIIGGSVGILVALAIPSKMKTVKIETKIVCLQDNNSTKGNFFLGSGNIDGIMKYSYYVETSDGGFKLKQTESELSTIKYSTEEPKIIEYKSTMVDPKNAFINYFALDNNHSVYEFLIPIGTIKTEYNLDAK